MGGRGSSGSRNLSSMSASDFKIEEKKWDKLERRNLENAVSFMSNEFGDIRDLIGAVYRRSNINAHGLYDREGFEGRGKATYFNRDYASEEVIIHEFTHAVTDEIASHYKDFGFKNRDEVYRAMRSEVYRNIDREEPKYDGRKWGDKPEEFLSRNLESYAKTNYTQENKPVSPMNIETLKVIKKWFRKARK